MASLAKAINFHGHLGPWLVLGLLMGEYGLKKISAVKYFGLNVAVSGLHKKPRSCLIDGLQLSTGCTQGKGNIKILKSKAILVNFKNRRNHKKITLKIKSDVLRKIELSGGHPASEQLAKRLYRQSPARLFAIKK